MLRVKDIITSAISRLIDSAVDYEPVTYTDGIYTPKGPRHIRAIHVNTDGDVTLRSLNGRDVTFTVGAGSTYAYTASSIVEDTTTAEIIALF